MSKKILVLHGPNLNLLGKREPAQYGRQTLAWINQRLIAFGGDLGVEVVTFQSNREGELIDRLHQAANDCVGVVFNPGGYTHTSVALRDAVAAIAIPVVEVHLSNTAARETFRQHSYLAPVCAGSIVGFGWLSYRLGLMALTELLKARAQGPDPRKL